MARSKNGAQRGALGVDDGVVADCGNLAGGRVVTLPRHLQHFHLAESFSDLLDAAQVIDVRMRQHDPFELAAPGKFLERRFEQVSVNRDALPRVEQNGTLRSADDISVGAGSGKRTRILAEHRRHARRDARVIGHLETDHRIGYDSLVAHWTFPKILPQILAPVAFKYQPKSLQSQKLVDLFNRLALGRDQLSQATGRDDARFFAALLQDAADEAVDQGRVAEDEARLNRADRRAAYSLARAHQLDAVELGGVLDQRIHRDAESRRDRSAGIFALAGHVVEGGCRA